MKAIILSNLTAVSNVLCCFNECGFGYEIINTETDKNYKTVPDNPDQVEVLGNIYPENESAIVRAGRFAFGLPAVSRFIGGAFTRIKEIQIPGDTDFIFANWGAGIIPELNLIKSIPEARAIKTILNLESFPTSWGSRHREKIEIRILKHSLSNIDGFIVPTAEMLAFLKKHIPEIRFKKIWESPFYIPESFFKRNSTVDEPPQKDLLFLGQLNLSNNLNEVSHQILKLADKGITVSSVENDDIEHENLHFFDRFKSAFLKSGGLHQLAHTHKAALATYKFPDQKPYPSRFSTSLPHRFLMPLALGIPVALPAGYFDAMENIIRQKKVGIVYNSTDELKEFLDGNGWMEAKNILQKNQSEFTFNPEAFNEFCKSVMNG